MSAARYGTLHIILTEEIGATLTLSPADKKRLPQAAACIAPRAPTDLIEEVNSGASNRRSITAAVIAQMASLEDCSIALTGLDFSQPWGSARGVRSRIVVGREGKGGLYRVLKHGGVHFRTVPPACCAVLSSACKSCWVIFGAGVRRSVLRLPVACSLISVGGGPRTSLGTASAAVQVGMLACS